eukprot:CAMPEP_0203998804 /NCGR_PEP_ID=MMETSP0360-20130528/14250_1 /ASSEMBLY_ACC=CAM_ASM_000342 /TAXON_ID=268821 /ORGANISM="Scrippsiella Hangoei, Strain SHTV-5" /LENGTH=159 /DNA_ID=CAMNT_0050939895 /DNA_START=91 /DNA_END=571 /DNA_ORIENTATION=-
MPLHEADDGLCELQAADGLADVVAEDRSSAHGHHDFDAVGRWVERVEALAAAARGRCNSTATMPSEIDSWLTFCKEPFVSKVPIVYMPNVRSSTRMSSDPSKMMEYGASAITVAPNPTPNHTPGGPSILMVATPVSASKSKPTFIGTSSCLNANSPEAL